VVTVTGEGGVGKTSLAVQCLYDVAHSKPRQFDQIAWVTLKTSVLTTSGAREVVGALSTPVDALASAISVAGPAPAGASFDELVALAIELMSSGRVLLAIDNLETIDRDAIRPLLVALPSGSRVLVTSRLGIGEFEQRYKLNEMESPALEC
jgi:LuxR family glucitol operon transcriptional activator